MGTEPCGAVGTDGNGREFEGLPVNSGPHGNRPLFLADLVGADGVTDRDVADDAAADILPNGLDIGTVAETHHGAAYVGAVLPGNPGALHDTDHVLELEGIVSIEQWRPAIEA